MKEKPILFTAAMVNAIRSGRKDVTRRIARTDGEHLLLLPKFTFDLRDAEHRRQAARYSPYGSVGDRLWVRETWAPQPEYEENWKIPEHDGGGGDLNKICYRADERSPKRDPFNQSIILDAGLTHGVKKWRPSIFMPRWACRLVLDVVSVSLERLSELTEQDAVREGIGRHFDGYFMGATHPIKGHPKCFNTARDASRFALGFHQRGPWAVEV